MPASTGARPADFLLVESRRESIYCMRRALGRGEAGTDSIQALDTPVGHSKLPMASLRSYFGLPALMALYVLTGMLQPALIDTIKYTGGLGSIFAVLPMLGGCIEDCFTQYSSSQCAPVRLTSCFCLRLICPRVWIRFLSSPFICILVLSVCVCQSVRGFVSCA